jgi:hypothetical protein
MKTLFWQQKEDRFSHPKKRSPHAPGSGQRENNGLLSAKTSLIPRMMQGGHPSLLGSGEQRWSAAPRRVVRTVGASQRRWNVRKDRRRCVEPQRLKGTSGQRAQGRGLVDSSKESRIMRTTQHLTEGRGEKRRLLKPREATRDTRRLGEARRPRQVHTDEQQPHARKTGNESFAVLSTTLHVSFRAKFPRFNTFQKRVC